MKAFKDEAVGSENFRLFVPLIPSEELDQPHAYEFDVRHAVSIW